jgi:8-oxo-dGTP pyrophosphatase MutT (NUDIX family)
MYKIFINDIPLLISAENVQHANYEFRQNGNVRETITLIRDLLSSGRPHRGIFIHVNDEKAFIRALRDDLRYIQAAGGVVKNPEGKTLFIFRNDKWDLPKGKMEKGEDPQQCAIREVEEECGISGLSVVRELPSTYHTYLIGTKLILKRTYWYEMKYAGSQKPVPQTEEGITEVKWLGESEIISAMENTYSSIRELLSQK